MRKDSLQSRHEVFYKVLTYCWKINLPDAPVSCVKATSCLRITDFAETLDDAKESKSFCAASATSMGFFPKT